MTLNERMVDVGGQGWVGMEVGGGSNLKLSYAHFVSTSHVVTASSSASMATGTLGTRLGPNM